MALFALWLVKCRPAKGSLHVLLVVYSLCRFLRWLPLSWTTRVSGESLNSTWMQNSLEYI